MSARRRRKGGNGSWAQQRGSGTACLFSCTELLDRLRSNVKPHLELHHATAEPGYVSVWDRLPAATWQAVMWPPAISPFYCHTVNAIAFSVKASFTCSLKISVPIMGVGSISCRGRPEELRPLCAGQPAAGFLSNAVRDAKLELHKYKGHAKHACLCSGVTQEAEVEGHFRTKLVSSNFRPLQGGQLCWYSWQGSL